MQKLNETTRLSGEALAQAWQELKTAEPRLRIRNAAEKLGVSELELLATEVGKTATWLRPDFQEMFHEFHKMEKVMGLTRNDHVVIERKGVFREISFFNAHKMGQVVGHDIDLRMFMAQWKHCLAVRVASKGKVRNSLQIFSADGLAAFKIYTVPGSNEEAYEELVKAYTAEEQPNTVEVTPPSTGRPVREDLSDLDVDQLHKEWSAMEDTHEFFGILRKHKLTRLQAAQVIGDSFALQLQEDAMDTLLEVAAKEEVPIMAFVGNAHNIQIHTGPVKKIARMDQWLNVLDPDFNLHVDTDQVGHAWIVKKPTMDGIVTGVEFYDKNGEMMVQFFGKRKPGLPELTEWRALVEQLPRK
ncbi:MAG: ChuX/HutX family heme-like substrate-binding protein [Bacteroidota bacterium]